MDEAVITEVGGSVTYVSTICLGSAFAESLGLRNETVLIVVGRSRDWRPMSIEEFLPISWTRRWNDWRLMWYPSHDTQCEVVARLDEPCGLGMKFL